MAGFIFYLQWLAVMSAVTAAAFWLDKRRARHRAWRVSNMTLHTLEFLGGWPGAWLAIFIFRHKSRKRSYQLWLAVAVILHGICVALLYRLLDVK